MTEINKIWQKTANKVNLPELLSDVVSVNEMWDPRYMLNKIRIRTKYNNGYGASIIKGPGSYGYEEDKWEVAVLLYDENGSPSICYDTPITDDVVGCLDDAGVIDICRRIMELPPAVIRK